LAAPLFTIEEISGVGSSITLPGAGMYWIHDCSWNGFNDRVIYVADSSLFLGISECFFRNCIGTKLNGGVIYFSALSGSFSVQRICVHNCSDNYIQSHGIFLYSVVNEMCDNVINTSTFALCGKNTVNDIRSTLYLFNGHQIASSDNFSKNYAYYYSAIRFNTTKSSISQYNTVVNNNMNQSICMGCVCGSNFFNNDNYINNTQGYADDGLFRVFEYANATITKCIFINNNRQIVNAYANSKCFVLNCWILGLYEAIGPVVFQSIQSSTATHQLAHIRTALCMADISLTMLNTQIVCPTLLQPVCRSMVFLFVMPFLYE